MRAMTADLDAVCRAMRGETGVALAVHDKPDPDALGAAAGMLDLFAQIGVDAALYVAIRVLDNSMTNRFGETDYHQGDCVEFFLDVRPAAGGALAGHRNTPTTAVAFWSIGWSGCRSGGWAR